MERLHEQPTRSKLCPSKRPAMALDRTPLARRRTSLCHDTPLHGIMRRYSSYFASWRALALLARCNGGIGCMDVAAATFRALILSYLVPPGVRFQKSPLLWRGWRPVLSQGPKKRLRRDDPVTD